MRGSAGTRVNSYGRNATRALGPLAIAAAVALLLSGCSSDTIFPAVHDMPPPRPSATLTPDQVKQATDDLITERQHLSTEAPGSVQPVATTNAPAATGSLPPKNTAATTQPAAAPPATGVNAYAKP